MHAQMTRSRDIQHDMRDMIGHTPFPRGWEAATLRIGLLTCGSSLPRAFPSRARRFGNSAFRQSGTAEKAFPSRPVAKLPVAVRSRQWPTAGSLPTHSGGTVLDSLQPARCPGRGRPASLTSEGRAILEDTASGRVRLLRSRGRSEIGSTLDLHGAAVRPLQLMRRHHLLGSAEGLHRSVRQQQQTVAVLGRQVEVVGDQNRRPPPIGRGGEDRLHHVALVAEVQVGGRLVQQEQRRLLGQGPRQGDELSLAARQLVHPPVRQRRDARRLHGHPRHVVVPRAPGPARRVWVAAHQHHLAHAERKRHLEILGDDGHLACQSQPAHRGHVPAVDQHGAALRDSAPC